MKKLVVLLFISIFTLLQAQIFTIKASTWHLVGAKGDIDDLSIFSSDCVGALYTYGEGWSVYKPESTQEFSSIAGGVGFWIYGVANCTIDTEQTTNSTSSSSSLASTTSTEKSYTFTQDDVDYGIAGVSPEAILIGGEVWLYVTDMGLKLYQSEDGTTFGSATELTLNGSDPTIIPQSDGSYRMYYVQHNRNEAGVDTAQVRTATSTDGINWSDEAYTGILNETGNDAWGVPDSIKLPDGNVRIYWVSTTGVSGEYEVILSALSENGTDFTEEDGYRTTDGYVDPYILKAEDGNWIGLFATTPANERLPQKIYVGYSEDGLTWSIDSDAAIAVSGKNNLDPTAVQLSENSYRIYFSA